MCCLLDFFFCLMNNRNIGLCLAFLYYLNGYKMHQNPQLGTLIRPSLPHLGL